MSQYLLLVFTSFCIFGCNSKTDQAPITRAASNSSDSPSIDDQNSGSSSIGWSLFTPSADTLQIYVSSSDGSDSNDGLSASSPLKTIQAGYAKLRPGFPDWLLLKKGDVFSQDSTNYWSKSGRSKDDMMLLSSYGSVKERPSIYNPLDNGSGAFIILQGVSHLAIVGIEVRGPTPSNSDPAGIEIFANAGSNILIEGCKISSYANGIFILPVDANPLPISNVKIRRNTIFDNYSSKGGGSGIHATNVRDILVEENFLSENGWQEGVVGQGGNSNNITITGQNILISKNISMRAANAGIAIYPTGGLATNRVEENLLVRNLIGIGSDPTGVSISNNIILDSYDYLVDPKDGTPPYKASHSFGLSLKSHGLPSSPNLIDGNIITKFVDLAPTVALWIVSNLLGNLTTTTIRNNIVNNFGGHIFSMSTYPNQYANFDQLIVDGNIFQDQNFNFPAAELQYGGALPNFNLFQFSKIYPNAYYSNRPRTSWFGLGINADQASDMIWQSQVDPAAVYNAISFNDPNRDCSTYHASLGKTASLAALETELLKQSKDNWRPEYEIDSMMSYLRAGFIH